MTHSSAPRFSDSEGEILPSPEGVRCTRGEVVESLHLVNAVVVTEEGREVAGHGDPDWITIYRSAAKPFQAIPLVEDGVVDRFGITGSELAITAASHNGERRHVETVNAILEKVGFSSGSLKLGPLPPLRAEAAEEVFRSGESVTPVHNNCSGQHAAMLGLAKVRGWDPDTYLDPSHPLQERMIGVMERYTGVPRDQMATMPDGCGMVAFGVPLRAMARSFARLGVWSRTDEGPARVLGAMADHPFMVGGTGRFCTALIQATGGRMIGKLGAEGVYGIALPEEGLGIAVKVRDGGMRAGDAAAVRVLDQLGLLAEEEGEMLEAFRRSPIRNTLGEVVGQITANFRLGPVEGDLS
jgi:L-asparaginase II